MGDKKINAGNAEVDGASVDSPSNVSDLKPYKGKGLECLFNEKSNQAAVVENGHVLLAAPKLEKNSQFWDNAFGITATLSNPENTLTVNPTDKSCIADGINGGKEIKMKPVSFGFSQ